jgi:hypothetical protein
MGLGNVIKDFEDYEAEQAENHILTADELSEYQTGLALAQTAFATLVAGRETVPPLGSLSLAPHYRLSAIYTAQNMGHRIVKGAEVSVYVQPAAQDKVGHESLELSVHVPRTGVDPRNTHLHYKNSFHLGTLSVRPNAEPTRTGLQEVRDFNSLLQETLAYSQRK